MKTVSIAVLFFIVHSSSARTFTLDATISHGFNNFNGKRLADYTASSNLLGSLPPLNEIGVINNSPGALNATVITPSTPLRSVIGSMNAVVFQNTLGFPPGVGPFNIPLQETSVNTAASTELNDRTKPNSFSSTKNPSNLVAYLPKGADPEISLADWNRPSARITNICRSDGTSTVVVRVRRAFPNALYTVWDTGLADPLTPREAISLSPLGGVVNLIVTDGQGNGSLKRSLNYCLFDKCPRSKRCTAFVSMFYHFDHQNYGAAPTLDAAGPAVGVAGADHLTFAVNGKQLISPQNPFRSS